MLVLAHRCLCTGTHTDKAEHTTHTCTHTAHRETAFVHVRVHVYTRARVQAYVWTPGQAQQETNATEAEGRGSFYRSRVCVCLQLLV